MKSETPPEWVIVTSKPNWGQQLDLKDFLPRYFVSSWILGRPSLSPNQISTFPSCLLFVTQSNNLKLYLTTCYVLEPELLVFTTVRGLGDLGSDASSYRKAIHFLVPPNILFPKYHPTEYYFHITNISLIPKDFELKNNI